MKKNKEASTRQIFSNILFCLQFLFSLNKKMFVIRLISVVISAVSNFIPIVFLRFIINEVSNTGSIRAAFIHIITMVSAIFAVSIISAFISKIDAKENEKTTHQIKAYIASLAMKMKYSDLEEPRMKDFISLAASTNPFFEILSYSTGFLLAVLNASGLSAIIFSIHPSIFIIMLIVIMVQIFTDKKMRNFQFYWKRITASTFRKMEYLYSLAYDSRYGKEIRVNSLENWVINKVEEHIEREFIPTNMQMRRKVLKFRSLPGTTAILQQAFIYIYLGYRMLFGSMLLGDFSMYLTSIQKFSDYVSGLVGNYSLLLSTGLTAQEIRYCITASEKMDKDVANYSVANLDINNFVFEFRNVSFKYPNTEKFILKNINLNLRSGQSLSLVGINDAGKTTFVKLLCRFYEPTTGEILLDGIPINKIPYDEYIKLFSVVFQDYKLFSYSVRENIAMNSDVDEYKLDKVIERAGLRCKIASLDHGVDTYMNKQFDNEGVEFSGGEGQKVAIARALYKGAPVVILDEPTSALDPMAEYEIYKRFSLLAEGKCAVYVSHRLSSTRFTDNIALFEDGELMEYGSHSQLMNINNGLYKKMFNMQAQYYV
ncbi:MAG: ABC transporter ATP-binding protein [Clostridia bacterium]|nr:ABC transporter ATP-binding protein [Clostridia bacterium]